MGEGAISLVAAEPGGTVVASIDGLTLRPVDGELAQPYSRPPVHPRWVELGTSTRRAIGDGGLAIVDSGGLGLAEPAGGAAVYPDLAALRAAIDGGAEVPATVLLGCVPGAPRVGGDVAAHARGATRQALDLLKTWLADDGSVLPSWCW